MIKPTLKMGAILRSGLALTAILAMTFPCHAQTANDESGEAITTDVASEKSSNLITPNWSRVLKDYVLIPSATPAPQITGPTGPTPTAQVTDRVKPREYLAPWREEYAAIRLGSRYFNGIIGGFEQASGLGFG